MGRTGFTGDPGAGYEEPEEDPEGKAEADALAAIAGFSLQQLLEAGHESLLRNLVKKSMAGTISHQEASILRNVLRDNGMTMGTPAPMKTIEHQQRPALPSFSEPDYEE